MSNLTRGTVCLSGRQAADWTSQSSWVQEEIRNVEGRDLLWLFYTVIIQRVIIWERGGAGREGKSFHFQKILTAPGDSTSKAGFVSENWHFSKALCANDVPSMLATLSVSSWNLQMTTLWGDTVITVPRSPGRSFRFEVRGNDLVLHPVLRNTSFR